jgi:1-acyl-sn-glycerol-3-phosphate acyltransferase
VNAPARLWYAVLQQVARVLFVTAFGIRVYGRRHLPLRGGVLVVSNHQSYLDPVLAAVGMPRPYHPMARASLFRFPPFAWLIRSLHAFPVKRGSADMGAIREALRRLKGGAVVLMFPEGTRTRDGSIGRLQAGPVLLARRAGVPVLPMVIDGAFEAWPRTRPVPLPHPIRVACGRPFFADELAEGDADDLVETIRGRMVDLQRRLRSMTETEFA